MSDLNDFLKVLSEGKKQAIESNPGKKHLQQLKEDIKASNPFEVKKEEPVPVTKQVELKEVVVPEVKPAAEQVPMDVINKYLSQNASFQQPNPDKVDPNMRAVQDKLKFLEQAIGRIAATGPGSGEVNFRYLDDVDRSTMSASNDNWVLEYDTASKGVKFTNSIGPIEHVKFDINHIDDNISEPPGTLSWNKNDHTLNIHHTNDVVQQIGQEQYYLVRNNTGSDWADGTVVMFSGAVDDVDGKSRLTGVPMLADGTYPGLYIMGVTTQDIVDGTDGFVTSFGRVSDINTLGGAENWAQGDILYVSPSVAGQLTKYKPTSPNNSIPVAAVLRVGTTDGSIFVRPTPEQRYSYGRFSDTTDQVPLAIDTPYAVLFNTVNVANGFHIDGGSLPASTIVAEQSGYYHFTANLSLTSTNSSAKAFYIWMRKNGVDIPYSTRRQSVTGNNTYQILGYEMTVSMDVDDYVEIMYAASDVTISINSPASTAFAPAIPSVTLLVTQVAL